MYSSTNVNVLSSLPLSITHLTINMCFSDQVRPDSESIFITYNFSYFIEVKPALKGAICIYETVIITLFLGC